MTTAEVVSIVGLVITLTISISTYLKSHFVSKEAAKKDLEYERRFTKLETNADLFYKVIEKDIGNMLHSPHRAALDRLIEKNNDPDRELSREEAIEMVSLLDEMLATEKLSYGEKFGITVHKASLISRYGLKELVPQ
jgi:hypothetical protein